MPAFCTGSEESVYLTSQRGGNSLEILVYLTKLYKLLYRVFDYTKSLYKPGRFAYKFQQAMTTTTK